MHELLEILLLACSVFLVVTLVLTIILLLVKNNLYTTEQHTVIVNGEKNIAVNANETLLNTLAAESIYLPSGCGGKSTCGLCKCKVKNTDINVLPTEEPFFTNKEIKEGYHLACQVKIKNDMDVEVDSSVFNAKKIVTKVISNNNVATFIKELVLKLPDGIDFDFQAGQYIQIYPPEGVVRYADFDIDEKYRYAWKSLTHLECENDEETMKAYSMANYPEEKKLIKLNVRIAPPPVNSKTGNFKKINPGICSSYIFNLKQGDDVVVSGPFGDFIVKDTDREIVFIGGGAGMAPLRSQIFTLLKTKNTSRKISYWYGARTLAEAFYLDELKEMEKTYDNFTFKLALSEPQEENGKFVHRYLYDAYLSNHNTPEDVEYYLCGPNLMLQASLKMLESLGVPSDMIMYDDFGS